MVKTPAPAAPPAVDPAMLAAIVQALAAAGVAPIGAASASSPPKGKGKAKKSAPTGPVTASTRPGKRDGFVEVVFSSKPADEVREALKGAGYRWAHSTACWYGLEAALPAAVASMVGGK